MSRAHVLNLFDLMFLLYKTVGLNHYQDPRCAIFMTWPIQGGIPADSCEI
jgi:hypothetical protein